MNTGTTRLFVAPTSDKTSGKVAVIFRMHASSGDRESVRVLAVIGCFADQSFRISLIQTRVGISGIDSGARRCLPFGFNYCFWLPCILQRATSNVQSVDSLRSLAIRRVRQTLVTANSWPDLLARLFIRSTNQPVYSSEEAQPLPWSGSGQRRKKHQMAGYAPMTVPPKLEKKPVKFSNLLCRSRGIAGRHVVTDCGNHSGSRTEHV